MEKDLILDSELIKSEQSRFMVKVYGWMSFALALTGLVAYFTAQSPELVYLIFSNRIGFWILFGAQLGIVIFLTARINKMSAAVATGSFVLYSIITGFVLSSVFFVFTEGSIASTFFITGGTFAFMSILGYYTKTDLTSFGKILMMALVGLIIATVVNLFVGGNSGTLYWVTTYAGVLIFTGLVAYDTQKIKEMNIIGNEGTEEDKKEAILGALSLYLDFINLFLFLLRIFGDRK
jgi:FtsH-binding integral membrane protein